MSRKTSRSDLITGVFAVLVIASFVAVVAFVQDIERRSVGDKYSVRFDDVGGLSGAAPVIVAGRRVGRVDSINTVAVTSDTGRKVEVEVVIVIEEEFAKEVKVPNDSIVAVQMGGLFGGNQVVLKLGRSTDYVRPGDRIPTAGVAPTSFNDLMEGAGQTMKKLQEGVDKLAEVLNKDDFSRNIERTIEVLASAVERLDKGLAELQPAFGKIGPTFDSANELLAEVRAMVAQNTEGIRELVKNLQSATGRLDGMLGEGEDGVPALLQSLNTIAASMDVLLESLTDVVLDNQVNIQISMQNVRDATASLRVFARRIERDPSLLVWGDSEDEKTRAALDAQRATPNVDELSIRNSGRRPRKESD